jgi:hypothetical protein
MAEFLIPSLISPQAAYPLTHPQLSLPYPHITQNTMELNIYSFSIAVMRLQYRKAGTSRFMAQISQKTSFTKCTCGH